jgi:Lipopolysaccharide-assembly
MKSTLSFLLSCLVLSGCAGYQLGGHKPPSLKEVHTVSVTMFENGTLHPRAEAIATSAVAAAIVQDGTYRIASAGSADAVLEGTVRQIKYDTIRGARFNVLRPEELNNTVVISWVLRDGRDVNKILASGTSQGHSQLFVSENLQTARNNALPEAMERAGEALVSRLANGY